MQFSTSLFALAAAMTVSADVSFHVADFSASCIPHSAQCAYDFTLVLTSIGETAATGVSCNATLPSDGTLPAVTDGTCDQSSRTWTVTKLADGGLELAASAQVSRLSYITGSYAIPAADLVIEQTGASSQQKYTGATAFDLTS